MRVARWAPALADSRYQSQNVYQPNAIERVGRHAHLEVVVGRVTASTVARNLVRIQRSAKRQPVGRRQPDLFRQAFFERSDEAQRIPQLVVEASRLVALFFIETQLLRFEPHLAQDAEAEPVGAVLLDQIHRVDRVAEALAHLAALQIEHQRRDEHGRKRHAPDEVQPEHHHARRPRGR